MNVKEIKNRVFRSKFCLNLTKKHVKYYFRPKFCSKIKLKQDQKYCLNSRFQSNFRSKKEPKKSKSDKIVKISLKIRFLGFKNPKKGAPNVSCFLGFWWNFGFDPPILLGQKGSIQRRTLGVAGPSKQTRLKALTKHFLSEKKT